MATLRDIRRRIRSVKNTQQITRAMKMVSAAKLRRAQSALISARPYALAMQEVLCRVAARTDDNAHPFLVKREGKRRAYLVVTADRGLCSGFNANLIRKAVKVMQEKGDELPMVFAVGRKGRDYFKRRKYPLVGDFTGLGDNIAYTQAQNIGETVRDLYLGNLVDEVWLVYPLFVAEILCHGEASQTNPHSRARRLVHLSKDQSRLAQNARICHF